VHPAWKMGIALRGDEWQLGAALALIRAVWSSFGTD